MKFVYCLPNYQESNFRQEYREHINDIRQNKEKSRYSQLILNTGRKYGTTEDTLKILYKNKKGRLLNTVEQFYIYINTKQNSHLNNLYSDSFNPIYNTLLSYTNSTLHKNGQSKYLVASQSSHTSLPQYRKLLLWYLKYYSPHNFTHFHVRFFSIYIFFFLLLFCLYLVPHVITHIL
jgi:hypothetical protein